MPGSARAGGQETRTRARKSGQQPVLGVGERLDRRPPPRVGLEPCPLEVERCLVDDRDRSAAETVARRPDRAETSRLCNESTAWPTRSYASRRGPEVQGQLARQALGRQLRVLGGCLRRPTSSINASRSEGSTSRSTASFAARWRRSSALGLPFAGRQRPPPVGERDRRGAPAQCAGERDRDRRWRGPRTCRLQHDAVLALLQPPRAEGPPFAHLGEDRADVEQLGRATVLASTRARIRTR